MNQEGHAHTQLLDTYSEKIPKDRTFSLLADFQNPHKHGVNAKTELQTAWVRINGVSQHGVNLQRMGKICCCCYCCCCIGSRYLSKLLQMTSWP